MSQAAAAITTAPQREPRRALQAEHSPAQLEQRLAQFRALAHWG